MIQRDNMMAPMVAACPSFAPKWTAFLNEWKDDKKGLPLYLALADLARHVISMLEQGATETFPLIFNVVELWHADGEPYVQEAATVGFLEALQNSNLHQNTRPEQFRQFLGPLSGEWWDKLNGFWEHGELLRP